MKTYVWLEPEKLKFINDNPKVVSLLYDLGLLPEEISARVRGYVEEERERCAKIAEDAWNASADTINAKDHAAGIARAIRGADNRTCEVSVPYGQHGGAVVCRQPLPCRYHAERT